ncbi:hypothetical protein [Helicobacter sp. MIT 14-3879]|uniref:hypothetical protein n=1 Tax=Helicobacter sp. MIT 14-3879 TaxID=2040649 RepID=UPI000E1F0B1E|nr:hypothetical protein [Helicobacter sp. MIT 14-3879]RDU65206.1 hypothetical protein CQA44_02510 [Helicobacter sp. MIT 14-3879]
MDSRLSIDLYIAGRKMQVNIACINSKAKDEIQSLLSQKNLDIKDILKAYIQKTQEYSELEQKLSTLIKKIETLDKN